ncbi:hypothetical protein [Neopusillimonas maritima]|uniref:Uncharacterized protein n=1 Tax=Neopusillimonas maritima TaxID=2026239 RepID=A0A3A1YY99_9BURK|nr:hypothetical protein [Neopusillimonas maritima]RIY41067.1 hypothetical protein CJP73_07925 [Neopusillimonas maritima]
MLPDPPSFDPQAPAVTRRWSDPVSEVMYNSAAPSERGMHENVVLIRVRDLINQFHKNWLLSEDDTMTGHIVRADIAKKLNKLDKWLFPNIVGSRLSGEAVLEIAKLVDNATAVRRTWLEVMPGLDFRNEELNRGRNWSALLRPEALKLLTDAINREKAKG